MIGEDPASEAEAAITPQDAGDALDRERQRARQASADARSAERESVELRDRLNKLRRELDAERRRYRALRQRRATRLALGLADGFGRLTRSVTRRRAASEAPRPPTAVRTFEGVDPRAVPRRYREALLAALLEPRGGGQPLKVSLAGEATDELRTVLTARGYEVSTTSGNPVDVAIVADPAVDPIALPAGVVRVAWTAAAGPVWPADAVAEYDIVVATANDPGQAFVDAVEQWLRATRVAIRVPSGNARTAAGWGDTYLARDLRAALRVAGWPTRTYFYDRWNDPAVGVDDIVIDLLGRYIPENRPGAVRVLWQISHPELASAELYRSYDLVFVASDGFARLMADEVPGLPVRPLHQATDPARFSPTQKGEAHELLYVANWREDRPIVRDLLPGERRLSVFGRGWTPERLDPAHHAGEAIPNEQLSPYYAAASIVLNDHAPGMRREGFLSNRLYDAAAAGALVITDEVDGVGDEFDGGVVVYRDRRQLEELIDRFLAHPDDARALGERARRAVLARHTFAHRAQSLIAAIEPLLERQN